MKKILNFEEYSNRTNEEWNGDNYPPGSDTPFAPWNYEEPEDTRKIDSSKHILKLVATDNTEFALLKGPDGKHYLWYFDTSDPDFQENYLVYDERMDDYLEADETGIEAAANDVPKSDYGYGSDDWESGQKSLIEVDQELLDDLIEQMDEYKQKGTMEYKKNKEKFQNALKSLSIGMSNESLEFGNEVLEAEGIHPAIKEKLTSYLKDNPDATFAEAKKFIGEKIAGWKLSEEDFEEAKKMM